MNLTSSNHHQRQQRLLMAVCVVSAVLTVVGMICWPTAQGITTMATNNPVTVQFSSPLSGSIVSNRITLTAEANSLAGPIAKVEFYVGDADGNNLQLITIVTNTETLPQKPTINLNKQP